MQTLKQVAKAHRFAVMQPAAVQARNDERLALAAAIDQANAPALVNHTPQRNGRSRAICQCCSKQSLPAAVDSDGEPDLWRMARGWSQAPLPADYRHSDGSVGSTYTCPACNARLHRGETLQLRAGNAMREVQ